jgi:hypothetical protein
VTSAPVIDGDDQTAAPELPVPARPPHLVARMQRRGLRDLVVRGHLKFTNTDVNF